MKDEVIVTKEYALIGGKYQPVVKMASEMTIDELDKILVHLERKGQINEYYNSIKAIVEDKIIKEVKK